MDPWWTLCVDVWTAVRLHAGSVLQCMYWFVVLGLPNFYDVCACTVLTVANRPASVW
jgi:hypothetical protein